MSTITTNILAVIDSGFGGLLAYQALHAALPNTHLVYHGDSLFAPYGEKSPDFLRARVPAIIRWLHARHHLQGLLVACNTSAAVVRAELADTCHKLGITLWDILDGANRMFEDLAQHGITQVGVFATPATTASGRYEDLAAQHGIRATVISCPKLVPLVEKGGLQNPAILKALEEYFHTLQQQLPSCHHLVLGCTHYPFLKEVITTHFPSYKVIDPMDSIQPSIVSAVQSWNSPTPNKLSSVYSSGDPAVFRSTAQSLLHGELPVVTHTHIDFKE